MNEKSINRWIIAAFIVHGLGHFGGYWMLNASWVNSSLSESHLRWLFVSLWGAAGAGFLGAALGLSKKRAWWRSLAAASALASLPSTLLFFALNLNLVGALVMDLAVLAWSTVARGPRSEQIGV